MKNKTKHDLSIISTSTRRNSSAQTSKRCIFLYVFFLFDNGRTGLTVGTRVSVTPEKRIPKKKKNIKYKALSPFLTVNKRLLNKDNDDNPETTDTSQPGKDDMSHTSLDDFTEKNDKKITNNDDEYREETSKTQEGSESVDNSETSDT